MACGVSLQVHVYAIHDLARAYYAITPRARFAITPRARFPTDVASVTQ
eukprot:CAMPEP_0203779662 /NCGR_PEP_ID=MMETSP0099_2-20121227/8839_1 /ASSEMBLY_ACC=CAM_ASM_000209 /TAXON_ID=96639 /ORGANISM=" , Strain NY0313808BC1" /LENGTH=47 /DNA_ID= /DNA_START= /DNA_END= /DNA_ORIENTATION=